ncbi:MAG: FAD-dependent oxidoreductase [Planctomycetaceae bacterium]
MSGRTLIIGQGLAGTVLAWHATWRGDEVWVLDAGASNTASAVAAGLVMPLSGQKLVQRPDYQRLFDVAENCYRRIERETGQSLFRRLQIERRFVTSIERENWEQRRSMKHSGLAAAALQDSIPECVLLPDAGRFGALQVSGAQLNVSLLMKLTQEQLLSHNRFFQLQIDSSQVEVQGNGVRIAGTSFEADRLFFCEGHRGRDNCWFPGQPDQPVRGELLRVRLNRALSADVLVGQVWAAPVPGAQETMDYLIGATWDRELLEEGLVTAEGRAELLLGLASTGDVDLQAEVTGHTSGIRASTRQRQVLTRIHPAHPQLGMLNGLGSWGSLTAPAASLELLKLQEDAVNPEIRLSPPNPAQHHRRSLTQLAHSIARRAFRPGDRVLDATAGNGHDTAFLAAVAGPAAVTAIDLQPQAIAATQARLGLAAEAITLIVGDHAELLEQQLRSVPTEVRGGAGRYGVIMFNLGYLPGSDRSVVTQPETTRRALVAALQLLRPGGVLTAIVYRGHVGGTAEYSVVERLAGESEGSSVDVLIGDPGDSASPVLFVFRAHLTGGNRG